MLLASVIGSATIAALARAVLLDDERRILAGRADGVVAAIDGSLRSSEAALRMIAPVGAWGKAEDRARLFHSSAGRLIEEDTAAVGVAAPDGPDLRILARVGRGPAVGSVVTDERRSILSRALSTHPRSLVSGLIREGDEKRLVLARARVGATVVAFQEIVLDDDHRAHPFDGPFADVSVTVYASAERDDARLVSDVDPDPSFEGLEVERTFSVGADEWLLVLRQRKPIVGSFTSSTPWIVFGTGIIGGLLASATVETITRRRAYALQLVDERTGELERTQRFLERLLTAGPVVVRRIDAMHRRTTYVSPNCSMVLDLASEPTAQHADPLAWVDRDDVERVDAALQRVVTGQCGREVQTYRLVGHVDGPRWVEEVYVSEAGADGQIVAVLAYLIDVHDRHTAEEQLRVAQRVAESANREKSQFLSRMSHELRTPLNAILGFAQLLELDELTPEQRDSVEYILKGGRHLLALINEVLDISRIEAGELSMSPEPVLVADLLAEALDLMRPLADERGIQLVHADRASCQIFVLADRQRVKQVVLNLLSNAIKYNRVRGSVAVSCAPSGSGVVQIEVQDTGPGIPAERLDLLFTPFERLGAEHSGEEGTGIGLALSQHLVEAMGGRISVSSQLGRGSSFCVELPIAEGPVERYERLTEPSDGPAAGGTARAVVLHIEDNLSNATLLERVLTQRPDIELVSAMHGGLGLELARQHRPALILLDLHLPDLPGEEVLRELLAHPLTASTPVVIVSADASPNQVRRLVNAGAAAYLTKPLDVVELLMLIDQVTSDD